MDTMRVVQVSEPGAPFEIVERKIPKPGSHAVRIKVQACGICHSDSIAKEGLFPNLSYPLIPGHEVAGIIDAVGEDVPDWKQGQRVGVGWHGGYCGHCTSCRRGDFFACAVHPVTGITIDGGYAEYMIAAASSLARLPDALPAVEAAPLMCAGITTFNALRNSGARAGEVVAVLGVGGLGHLAIQFATKMGMNTVAIARGKDKEPLARSLGARHYIDSKTQDPAAELLALGGAKVILATVTSGDAMAAAVGGVAPNGTLVVIGAPESLQVPVVPLLSRRAAVKGWYSGTSIDSEDTLSFSVMVGVRSMNEVFPLQRAAEAYERMMSGKARFRVVLTTGH